MSSPSATPASASPSLPTIAENRRFTVTTTPRALAITTPSGIDSNSSL